VKRILHELRASQIRWLLGGAKRRLLLLVASSVAAGLAEAGVLAVVAQVAISISADATRANLDLGPLPAVHAELRLLLVAAFLFALLRLVLQVVAVGLAASLCAEVQARLRMSLLADYLRAAWPIKAQQREGRLQELLTTQVNQASRAVLLAGMGIGALVIFGILIVAALLVSPLTAILTGTAACALFVALRPVALWTNREASRYTATHAYYAESMSELVRLGKEIEASDVSSTVEKRSIELGERVRQPYFRVQFLTTSLPGVYQSAVILLVVLGLVVLHASGASKTAALGTVVLLLVRALAYTQQVQHAYHQIREVAPFIDGVRETAAQYREVAIRPGDRPLEKVERIGLEDVSFAYAPGRPVLQGVTAEINRGEAVGIVGPSGVGKSTFLEVLLRLRQPTSGRYLINGLDAAEITMSDWRRAVGFVPQDTQLLTGTVAENIRFLRPWIGDRHIEQAARMAHIDDDIVSWPSGYETLVSQRAEALSGGQRQRICLARALAGQPEVLVLDEPTSALDARSEELIQESLASLRGRITIFVVAHRLALLRFCTRIMAFRDGRLAAVHETDRAWREHDLQSLKDELISATGSPSAGGPRQWQAPGLEPPTA
jgi:ATP-binding cassette subfamily B protein